jgi:hypothetical protein
MVTHMPPDAASHVHIVRHVHISYHRPTDVHGLLPLALSLVPRCTRGTESILNRYPRSIPYDSMTFSCLTLAVTLIAFPSTRLPRRSFGGQE